MQKMFKTSLINFSMGFTRCINLTKPIVMNIIEGEYLYAYIKRCLPLKKQ